MFPSEGCSCGLFAAATEVQTSFLNVERIVWLVFGFGISLDIKEVFGILLKIHHFL